jgi:hypothetical protein
MKSALSQPFHAFALRLALIFLPAAPLLAASVDFDDAGDLNANFTHAKTTPMVVSHAATSGVNGSGAIRLQNSASADAGFAAVYSPATLDATGATNVWTTSIFFDTQSLGGDPAPFVFKEKEKLKVSLGFSGTNNLTDPRKFFDKKNTNNAATFRAQMFVDAEVQVEHDTGKQARLRLRLRSFPSWDQETQGPHKEITIPYPGPYDDFATWYRLDFRLEFLGAGQFALTSALYDVGPDGTGTPEEPVHEDSLIVTNAAFAGYNTVYSAFSAEVEKKASGYKIFHLDSFSVQSESVVPNTPTSLAASSVLANAAIANWEPAAEGAATTGFVVEVTTAADDFAPGTFLAADGSTGQASGIVVADPAATSQVLTGLLEDTDYIYRILATNQAGGSAPSAPVTFQTLGEYINAQPTLDPLSNLGPLWPNNPPITVLLSGITQGLGDTGQTLTITATSSDPSIVPDPVVNYTSPDQNGSLILTPAGGQGSATITVTVDDGQMVNNTITRTFTFTTRIPPALVDFDSEASVQEEFLLPNTQNGVLYFDEEGGSGDPPSGGLYFQGIGTDDNGVVLLRNQPYFMNPLPSSMRNSILINASELAQDPSGSNKHRAEIELGFRNQIEPLDPKAKDFFSKGGSTNRAATVRLQFEHEPAKDKTHILKARLRNFIGTSTSGQSPEIGVQDDISLFQNWLRLSFEIVPLSTSEMLLIYQIHDLGPDGINPPELVFEDSITVSNPGFLTAPEVYAGVVISTEKNMPNRGVFLDRHRVDVLYTAPEAPTDLIAATVTAHNALLKWQRAEEGAVPFSYILELSTEEDFPADSFVAANGTTGQSAGIGLNSPTAKSQQITGLLPGTTYYFRVRGANGIGESDNSEVFSFTTLAAGVNAPPTLDPIADINLTVDAGEQTVLLKGITDGGELDQTVTFTAVTDDTALIQNLEVFYDSPLSTGELVFTPALNVTGSATITVTANDGASNNNTTSRTFTVAIINVDELIPFDFAEELEAFTVFTQSTDLIHVPTGGVGPQPGKVEFTRDSSSSDKAAMALRPYAYDARAAGYWITSLFVHASEIGSIETGKDKIDLRLGFVTTDEADDKLKDTFHKTQAGLGVKFKLEHEPSKSDKLWQIEAESYSSTPTLLGGFNESKGAKRNLQDPGEFNHWLKLVVQVVRKSATQYEVSYAVEDWGTDGTAFVSTLLSGPVQTFTNAAFAKDPAIFAGFLIDGEKNQNSSVFLDNHEVIANTKAPDAPRLLPAFGLSSSGFTISWNPAVIGRAVTGFVVQLVRNVADFVTGLFLGTDGSEQNEGIVINDPDQQNLTFTGLNPYTEYFWRVLAFNNEDTSLPLAYQTTRTDALSFEEWREANFPDDFFDDEISGPYADPTGSGVPNLLLFALGGDLNNPGAALSEHGMTEDGFLTITFRRRGGSGELIYDVQYSTDLTQPWQSLPGSPLAVSEPDADGMETVTFRETPAMAAEKARFLRVRVELLEF